MSHFCPQTPDGRTDVYVILYSVQCICIALDRQIFYEIAILRYYYNLNIVDI